MTQTDIDPTDPVDWTDSGAFEVVPGVHRIPLPLPMDGLKSVNVYAIQADDGLVLIDSGWAIAEGRRQLEEGLDRIGFGLVDVARFLITHAHRDHYTQASVLRREFGMQVGIGVGERQAIANARSPRAGDLDPHMGRLRAAGAEAVIRALRALGPFGEIDPAHWDDPDEWLEPSTIDVGGCILEVIPTPGHTRGHVVFRDADRGLLFAGDHVLPHITPSIGFEPVPNHLPLGDYLHSLAAMLAIPDTELLPAHGLVTGSVHSRVDELIEHHRIRLDATLTALEDGASTGFDVAWRLPWTRRERKFADLDPFNQMLATSETVAHLDVLVARGVASVAEVDGVFHYDVCGDGPESAAVTTARGADRG